eukprot:scaffold241_cov340-Pavlova_lutheri.AAC.8
MVHWKEAKITGNSGISTVERKRRPRYRRRIEVANQTSLPFAWMADGLRSISERVALAFKMHSAFEMVVDRILLPLSSTMYSYFLRHEGDGEKNDI